MQQAVCPRCGSSAEVRTVAELFDMLNGMQDQAMQRAQQGMQQGQFSGQGGPGGSGNPPHDPNGYGGRFEVHAGGYSEYNQPGSSGMYRSRPSYDNTGDVGQDIANAVLGQAGKFLGRAIANKAQQAFQEKIVPAMQARAAQAQQAQQASRADQPAIVQKYPDLRGCLHDQVVFLQGGTRTIPIREIPMPITMANADVLVGRLRAP